MMRRRYNIARRSVRPSRPVWYVLGADGRRALWTQDEALALDYARQGYVVEGRLDAERRPA